jgi:hypothetical protein
MQSTMNHEHTGPNLRSRLLGRTFVHPVFDYALIGGGLSLLVTAVVVLSPGLHSIGYLSLSSAAGVTIMPTIILLSNSAHFASSTVRLYTKPDAFKALPFLTMGFPLVAFGVLSACLIFAGSVGPHLQALYLTWSPYHYAAQADGLSVMYSYRAGCLLQPRDKKLLWQVAMLPFLYNFVSSHNVGLHWIVPAELLSGPTVSGLLSGVNVALPVLAFLAPCYLFLRVWRSDSGPIPFISVLTLVANGVWFFVLPPLDAFVYATIFHGIQYLAIVIIFHVKEQKSRPENRHGTLYHVLWFYGVSLLLGYALFNCLPLAYVFSGFGPVESVLLVVAAINIHHFIVDAYIWRLKRSDNNRRVVDGAVPEAL